METAGAEDMPEDAEHNGLGTPATRARILEKIIKCGFVERRKKNLIPTDLGTRLVAVLPDEVKLPLMTAEWETRLQQIQSGLLADSSFMDGIAELTRSLITAHSAPLPEFVPLFASLAKRGTVSRNGGTTDKSSGKPTGKAVGKCPRCNSDIIESSKGFFCSNQECRFALWKDSRFWTAKGKTLDKKTASALLSEGRVFFSDLKSEKTGNTYAATVVLEDTGGKTDFRLEFDNGSKGGVK